MDPLTQGTLGAALPQSVARRENAALAFFCGVLAGMAPDLDVLIRSRDDPLLFLEYHRQFTHALVFIPIGAGLVAAAIWLLVGRRRHWRPAHIYLYCFLGYGTHAVLDACTTYGTMLLWPFSDLRIAWNNVSVIDPLLTLPLLALVLLARWQRRRWPAAVGLLWVLSYLFLGVLARDAAVDAGRQLAASRGHAVESIDAKPSFANIVLWKIVYREGDRYYVDAVRLGGAGRVYAGTSIAALDVPRDFPWLDPDSLQAGDIERFRWFSNGFLAADPDYPARVIDLRYSLLPNEIRPLWSIELDRVRQDESHVRYLTHRRSGPETLSRFRAMLLAQPLPGDDELAARSR